MLSLSGQKCNDWAKMDSNTNLAQCALRADVIEECESKIFMVRLESEMSCNAKHPMPTSFVYAHLENTY
jgi:hypothetical protein